MFNPTEIIFAMTTACNLHCPHCFVNREPFNLKTDDAINFLKSTHSSPNSSIERVGFSGGEPFLRQDFLCEVIKASIDMDFMFDRIMTNGDWWKTKEDLRATLQKVYDAGYDGKIGVSYDSFHSQSEERISTYIETAWEIFGGDSVEILSVKGEVSPYASSKESATLSTGATPPYPQESHTDSILLTQNLAWKLSSLASRLNLTYEENISPSGRGIATLTGGEIFLPAYIQTESYQAKDDRAFKDKSWFEDDFCQSMGQILFVHATGDIAPCCGFANENPALFIGKITDSFDQILEKSQKNKMVQLCFEKGLSSKIRILKAEGHLPAGKTGDICTFCDFVMHNS